LELFVPLAVPGAAIGAVVGAITGGIKGATDAVPSADIKEIDAFITKAIAGVDVQGSLAEHVASTGGFLTDYQISLVEGQGPAREDERPLYRSLSGQDVDTVIEVSVKSLGFRGGEGADPSTSFFMDVSVRVVRTADGTEIYSGESSHESGSRRVSDWVSRDGAALLGQEFEAACSALSKLIIEDLFFGDRGWTFHLQDCMLTPNNPPHQDVKFSKVDSLQPTVQWEVFPRAADWKSDSAGILAQVSEITYDLKIWKGRSGSPEDLVYERMGLSFPEHRIGTPLEPSTKYFWSVRARLKLDGPTRMTRWSYSRVALLPQPPPWPNPDPCLRDHIPINSYHGFETPQYERRSPDTQTEPRSGLDENLLKRTQEPGRYDKDNQN
jgi:hypothetical protein